MQFFKKVLNILINVVWGFLFIIITIFYAGDTLNLWHFKLFFDEWWALFIILPCLVNIIENGFNTGNAVGLTVSVLLLLSSQGIVNSRIISKLIVPTILILIGIKIIFRDSINNHVEKSIDMNINREGRLEYTGILSTQHEDYPNERFDGVSILAIFGGVDIIVLNNVNVKVSRVPIFGRDANKTRPCMNANAPTIYINATCIFGGLDSK